MLMILGASFTGVACWLVLGEAGVHPRNGGWARGVHVVGAILTLLGLTAPLGEFSFGVPQFQQIFHPIVASIAAGFALVAIRIVHGRWWTLGIVGFLALTMGDVIGGGQGGGGGGPVDTRAAAIYLASAACVEIIGLVLGVERRTRFALVSGLAIGTVGLAGEWAWNREAYQPWLSSLLPDAVILSTIGAVGAAVAGAAFGRVIAREKDSATVARPLLIAAAVAVAVVIALPLPRAVGDVDAAIEVVPVSETEADLRVTVTPADAADDARWFQATAWQGGGLVLRDLVEVDPGVYETEAPIPIAGGWKSLVRLHRGGELMTLPVYLPDDPEIGEPEIPAIDRSGPMQSETDYLLRETYAGNAWLAPVVHGLLLVAVAVWLYAFVFASSVVASSRRSSFGDGPVHDRVRPAP